MNIHMEATNMPQSYTNTANKSQVHVQTKSSRGFSVSPGY